MVDSEFSSQDHIKKTDIRLGIKILALPFIESGIDDIDLDIEVSDMMFGRLVPFASKFDISARSDSRWYFYV